MGKLQNYNLDRSEVIGRIGGGWFMLPNAWVRELMTDEHKYPHISASFWKFLIVLWCEILTYRPNKPDWTAELGMRDFGIRANTASKYTVALAASGLFTVTKGEWQGEKTTFRYNTNAGGLEWRAFYRALMKTCETLDSDRLNRGRSSVEKWESVMASHFKTEMAALREESIPA